MRFSSTTLVSYKGRWTYKDQVLKINHEKKGRVVYVCMKKHIDEFVIPEIKVRNNTLNLSVRTSEAIYTEERR